MCADDFYPNGGSCLYCGGEAIDDTEEIARALGIICFHGAVCACVLLLADERLDWVTSAFVLVQQMMFSFGGLADDTDLPAWLGGAYSELKVITFDYEWIRPGCTIGRIPYVDLFFRILFFALLLVAVMLLVGMLHQCYHELKAKRRKTCYEKLRSPESPRVHKGGLIAFYLMFAELCRRSMKILDCTPMPGKAGVARTLSVSPLLSSAVSFLCFDPSTAGL